MPSSRCFAECDWQQESALPNVNEAFDASSDEKKALKQLLSHW